MWLGLLRQHVHQIPNIKRTASLCTYCFNREYFFFVLFKKRYFGVKFGYKLMRNMCEKKHVVLVLHIFLLITLTWLRVGRESADGN